MYGWQWTDVLTELRHMAARDASSKPADLVKSAAMLHELEQRDTLTFSNMLTTFQLPKDTQPKVIVPHRGALIVPHKAGTSLIGTHPAAVYTLACTAQLTAQLARP